MYKRLTKHDISSLATQLNALIDDKKEEDIEKTALLMRKGQFLDYILDKYRDSFDLPRMK